MHLETMNTNDVDKAYISPYDKLIAEFDAENPKSASQLQEIKKHQRIAKLRDNAEDDGIKIWEEF